MLIVILLLLAAGYVLWCTLLFFAQDRIMFPREFATPVGPALPPAGTTVLLRALPGGTGNVEAWLLPAPGATPAQPAPLVVFLHGNAETIDAQRPIVDLYHALGCSVLLPEYRGYGRSAGRPSQRAIREDNAWFLDRALEQPVVDPARVIFHGRSLGAGIAADLATRRAPAALILESAFLSAARLAWRYGVPPWFLKHPFRTDRALAPLRVPTLIFHGAIDEIIPVAHGRGLHRLLPDSRYVEYHCRHNEFPGEGNGAAYVQEITRFMREHGLTTLNA